MRIVRLGTFVAGFVALALVVTAAAAEPIGGQFRVSDDLPAGDADFGARNAAVAHNAVANQYLVVWEGRTATDGETEIFARLMDATGTPIGGPLLISGGEGDRSDDSFWPAVVYNPTANEYLVSWSRSISVSGAIYVQRLRADGTPIGVNTQISDMAPLISSAFEPAIAYNPNANEYLVSWHAYGNTPLLATSEYEIYAQRVSAVGAEIGNDIRVSEMGIDGNEYYYAENSSVAYNSAANEYLVAWDGDDTGGQIGVSENEIYVQRLSADGAQIGADTRVSESGPDGSANYGALDPAIVYNPTANEYLVSWSGTDNVAPLASQESEIFIQRLASDGTQIGVDTRVSDMGPDGDPDYDASSPAVVYNPTAQEYLVSWWGDDNTAPLVDNKAEIHAQRISANGTEIGLDTRISQTGPDGSGSFGAFEPAVAFNATANEYMVAWHGGNVAVAPGVNLDEIYARRIKGGEAPSAGPGVPGTLRAPVAPNCVEVAPVSGGGASGTLKLTPAQLKINQRIGQAAIRRASAIQKWLDAGIVNDDLCGGGLTGDPLNAEVSYTKGLLQLVPAKAAPRALKIPAATPKAGTKFELNAEQLQINQRVYSAAVRRANALKARIGGKLTGGDIIDAQLTGDRLRQDLTPGAITPGAAPKAPSKTQVPPPGAGGATFTPTVKQLRINQKIAQAAVKRTNELRAILTSGLTGENFADGSITAADFVQPVRLEPPPGAYDPAG